MAMARTQYRPETDGYAFKNEWSYDDFEKQKLEQVVADALAVVEVVFSPIIIATIAPFVALELVFLGPFAPLAIDAEVKAINNAIISGISSAIEASNSGHYGLCGGMGFSSLDYWLQGWIVPRGTGTNDQPTRTTSSGTTLRNYIWGRLLDSVQDNGAEFLSWMMMILAPYNAGDAWLKEQNSTQFQNIKNGIDSGTPVPLGLVGTTSNPLNNHQVLCYGYDDHLDGTGSLILYDNNHPGVESRIDFDLNGSQLVTTHDDTFESARGPLRGFFTTTYFQHTPPKTVVLSQSLAISPACVQEQLPFDATYAVQNVGYHQSPAMTLEVISGTDVVGGEAASNPLDEGNTRAVDAAITLSGAGWRTLGIQADLGTFASIHIVKQLPPADTSQVGTAQINVLPQLRVDLQPPVANDPCSVWTSMEAGALATFALNASPPVPPGGSYQWSVVGASGSANNGPTFQVQMPAASEVPVTVSVVITYGNGCRRGGSLSLQTMSHFFALAESSFCRFHNTLLSIAFFHPPVPPNQRRGPQPPIPVGGTFMRQDLLVLQGAAQEFLRGLDRALGSSPGEVGAPGAIPAGVGTVRTAVSPEATVIMPFSSGGAAGLLRLPSGRSIAIVTDRAEVGRGISNTEEAAAVDLTSEQDKLTVSRIHALIIRSGDRFEIEDLRSANGTMLNGQKLVVGQRYPLQNGDVIEFGKVRCIFTRG